MIINTMKKNSKFKMPDTVVKKYSGGTQHVFWKDGGYVDRGYIGDTSTTKKKAKDKKQERVEDVEEETTTIIEERDNTPVEETTTNTETQTPQQ